MVINYSYSHNLQEHKRDFENVFTSLISRRLYLSLSKLSNRMKHLD